MQVLHKKKADSGKRGDDFAASGVSSRNSRAAFLAFLVLGTFLSLFYNLLARPADNTFTFDSAHYLQSSALLFDFCIKGKTSELLVPYLSIDGTLLPAAGALVYFLCGKAPSLTEPLPVICLQSLLHGLSTALLYVLLKRVSGLSLLPVLLAFAFGCGSGVIAAGRYLSETFAAVSLLALMAQSSAQTINNPVSMLTTGFISAVTLLIRPALAPAVVLVDAVAAAVSLASESASGLKDKLAGAGKKLALLAAGALVVIAPLTVFNFTATGKAQVVPERLPGWNIALGSDVETDGWSAIPVPPLLELNYFDKPLPILFGAYSCHKTEFLSLCVRKVFRLFQAPWNDFKESPFGLPLEVNLLVHQILLALAACGLGALFIRLAQHRKGAVTGNAGIRIALAAAAALAGHLVFIPFESIPRYAYSAMPAIFILAAYFAAELSARRGLLAAAIVPFLLILLDRDNLPAFLMQAIPGLGFEPARQAMLVGKAVCAATIFSLLMFALPVRKETRDTNSMALLVSILFAGFCASSAWAFLVMPHPCREWKTTVDGGTAAKEIFLRPETAGARTNWAAILVDGDESLSGMSFALNGKVVQAPAISIYDIPHPYVYQRTLLHTIDNQAQAQGTGSPSIRQWRMVFVPVNWLLPGNWNRIEVRTRPSQQGATIYGDYPDGKHTRCHLPALQSFALCKLQADATAGDGRPVDITGYRRAQSRSIWLPAAGGYSNDLSVSAPGKQDGQYRLFIITASGEKPKPEQSTTLGMTFAGQRLEIQ